MSRASVDVVVPTIGRPSLFELLGDLAANAAAFGFVYVVDDRGSGDDRAALADAVRARLGGAGVVLRGSAAGPAAARNTGWRASDAEWIAFVDDDVRLPPSWGLALQEDLAAAAPETAGVQGRIRVPLPIDRRPTDWERNIAGLESARWATADMAYRRMALKEIGGFDERFRRAYREDADLALRLMDRGYRLEVGRRTIDHPARPTGFWTSVRLQAGNADDVLMDRLHGRGWRERAHAPRGRRDRHLASTAAGVVALAGFALGRRRLAAAGAAAWLGTLAELSWARVTDGPKTPGEVVRMLVTSAALPPAATWHWLRGSARWWGVRGAAEVRR